MVKKDEFLKNMTMLTMAYGKEYTEEEVELYYEFLKDYDGKVLTKAIKEIIATSTFAPKIAELKKMCEHVHQTRKYEILDMMLEAGYFKNENGHTDPDEEIQRYEKASKWLREKNIPAWFLEDLKQYQEKQKLTTKEVRLIE